MQLTRSIGGSLAAATCGLLGSLPTAAVAADEVPKWQVDTALLYWGEGDGRVQDGSLTAAVRRAIDEDRFIGATLTFDALTGCASLGVQPWERDLHSRVDMQPDELDAGIDDHIYFSKEASSGGRGFAGGGCGCN